MAGSIAFLESEEQIDFLIANSSDHSRDVQCIAVFPGVYEKALQANLSVWPMDDFGHVSSLAAYNSVTIDKIEQLTRLFDSLWDASTRDIDCARCVSFRAFFHPMKGFYDALVKRALPVLRALEKLEPDLVLVFSTCYNVTGFSLLDKPPQGLTSLLVPFLAAHKNLPTVSIEMEGVRNGFFLPETPLATISFAKACSLLSHGEAYDNGAMDTSIINRALLTFPYILENLESNFTHLLNKEGISVLYAYPPDVATTLPSSIRLQLCQSIAYKVVDDFFVHEDVAAQMIVDGIDLSPFIRPYIDTMLRNNLPELLSLSYLVCPFYKRFANSVLLSGGMTFTAFVLTRAARLAGIKTINQHRGGMLGYTAIPTLERYDLAEAEYFFVNGKGAVLNYEHPCEGTHWPEGYPRAKPVPVGAAWIWDIYKKCSTQALKTNSELKICYVIETDIGDYGYMGSHVRPSFLVYNTVKSVIDIFCRHTKTKLFIKEYPKNRFKQDDNFISEYLQTVNAPNITILGECSIASIVDSFDVFILDYPGTPLIELAASGKTIVLYAEEESYVLHANAQKLLAECSHYFKKLDTFLDFIEIICQNNSALIQKSMLRFMTTFVLPSTEQSPSFTIQKFIKFLMKY